MASNRSKMLSNAKKSKDDLGHGNMPTRPDYQFDDTEHFKFSQWCIENQKMIDEMEKSHKVSKRSSKN